MIFSRLFLLLWPSESEKQFRLVDSSSSLLWGWTQDLIELSSSFVGRKTSPGRRRKDCSVTRENSQCSLAIAGHKKHISRRAVLQYLVVPRYHLSLSSLAGLSAHVLFHFFCFSTFSWIPVIHGYLCKWAGNGSLHFKIIGLCSFTMNSPLCPLVKIPIQVFAFIFPSQFLDHLPVFRSPSLL